MKEREMNKTDVALGAIESAQGAIESYVNLIETITGIEVNWHALTGGPECILWFQCKPIPQNLRNFIDETKYIRDGLEVLMREAMEEYVTMTKGWPEDEGRLTHEEGLEIIEGAVIEMCITGDYRSGKNNEYICTRFRS